MSRLKKVLLSTTLLVGFVIGTPLHAKIQEVLIYAEGIYCETCNHGLLRQLRTAPGVDKGHLFLKDGVIQITLKEGHIFNPANLVRIMGKSSYNYIGMVVMVEGKVGANNTLIVPENDVTLKLGCTDEMTVGAKKLIDSSMGQDIVVTGYYEPNEQDPSMPIINVENAWKPEEAPPYIDPDKYFN